jgi:hypothetical protein
MGALARFPGFYGIVTGLGLFPLLWLIGWLGATENIARTGPEEESFHFDAQGRRGAFTTMLGNYLDIAKAILGLASGSIVLLVSSSAFHSNGRLPPSFASPLFLLALSILYGVLFMTLLMLDYENYQHHPQDNTYTKPKYVRNQTLGFSALLCFCVGYAWLIVSVTTQP